MLSLPLDCKDIMSGKAEAIFKNINTVFEWEIYVFGLTFPKYKMAYNEKQVSLSPCPYPSTTHFYSPEAVTVTCSRYVSFQRFSMHINANVFFILPTPSPQMFLHFALYSVPPWFLLKVVSWRFSTKVHRGLLLKTIFFNF